MERRPAGAISGALSGFGLAVCMLMVACGAPSGDPSVARDGEIAVRVDRVALDRGEAPVVILEEKRGSRWLPIWIGSAEARSIASQMAHHRSPRPNTHDLARSLIEGLEAEVLRVVVTELRSNTYYATLSLRVRDEIVILDSRPSDAIAIALRTDAPIFVREQLFDDPDEEPAPSEPRKSGGLRI